MNNNFTDFLICSGDEMIIKGLASFKADWLDVLLLKIAVFAATLLFAKLWTPILELDWYWYFLVWAAAAIKPFFTFYKWAKNELGKTD